MLDNNPIIKEVDKLRSILLEVEDFNLLNKLMIGLYMIRETYKVGVIHPDQYSRRKRQRLIEAIPSKYFLFRLIRMLLNAVDVLLKDVQKIYNRMQHSAISWSC